MPDLNKVMLKQVFLRELEKNWHVCFYFLLSLAVMGPLLYHGEIISLDMVLSQHPIDDFVYYIHGYSQDMGGAVVTEPGAFLFHLVFAVSNFFMPVWLFQKIVFAGLLFACGLGAHNACPSNKAGKLFAGTMYLINPFVYIRFLAGHMYILIAYAVLPLLFVSFKELFEKKDAKSTAKTALLLSVFAIGVHLLPLALLMLAAFFAANFFMKRVDKKTLKSLALALALFGFISSFFFVQMLFSVDEIVAGFKNITQSDVQIFASKPEPEVNVLFNTAAMYGFWRGGYILPKYEIPYWQLFFAAILFLAVYGLVSFYKNEKIRLEVAIVSVMAVVCLGIAVGSSIEIFQPAFNFLIENIVFFKGLREPHKALAFVVFAYSFLGGLGAGSLHAVIKDKKKAVVLALAMLLIPAVYCFTMFNGFSGQMDSKFYPRDYYWAESYLDADKDDFNVLVLPWHQYMDFKWNPKQRLGNPLAAFFSKPTIKGDPVEVAGVYSQSTNLGSRYVEFLLRNRGNMSNFGNAVSLLNVKYIVLLKESDYFTCDFLYNQSDLILVNETENLILFKNNRPTSRFYAGKVLDENWSLLVDEQDDFVEEKMEFKQSGATQYAVNASGKEKMLFSNVYSKKWEVAGSTGLKNFGVTTAFEVNEGMKEVKVEYATSKYYLAGSILSIAGLIGVCLIFAVFKK